MTALLENDIINLFLCAILGFNDITSEEIGIEPISGKFIDLSNSLVTTFVFPRKNLIVHFVI